MLRSFVLAAAAALALPGMAQAKGAPLLDCPLRDAPYSIDTPFVDLLLNPAAKQAVQDVTGKDPTQGPPIFVGTKAPTFAAILTIKEALAFVGGDLSKLPALDAKLRTIPVTGADKVARCERYDSVVPKLTVPKGKGPRLLLFDKINGFRDEPSVNAARDALTAMAKRQGWRMAVTDKGGAFNARTLAQFDAVIWNNISGDVLTLGQRKAFQQFLQSGGGFVGLHGSAGDPVYFWDWYPDKLIGARFAGHPMDPQFQEARIAVNKQHPLAANLPAEWRMTDEWYSFKTNPRAVGANVLLTLDESTYTRVSRFGEPLDMGADHPLAWTQCLGKGRMFYSAIGHLPATYAQDQNVTLMRDAIAWAAGKGDCR
ncbi:ThuA domain-containing protein [Novosphingobium sp. B 225]|uniref:ThuA domain-containing protein n=1 Tax=Novosphingobium sp. B 225 TaxID=1961849 RepID=UPI000B4C1309|nr:ThuA domain-containing protein [Novosphingobium sp. B 225]